jgi:PQQ enzyme repeat
MITKSQARITIGLTLAALLGSQMVGDRLVSAVSRSFTDAASEFGSRQNAVSDRSGERLNSDGTMPGVNLRRTRVYDSQGLQVPKSVLWKTPKLFITPPEGTYSGLDERRALIHRNITYHGALSVITANKEACFRLPMWVYRTKKPCPEPVAANGVIYVACRDNTLLAIDTESGQEKWKYETPHPLWSHPVVGDGVIYYLDREGVMYALGSS